MNKVLLIGFYNEKALGVKYLANSLNKNGFVTSIVYFKEFNSVKPSKGSEVEINLLLKLIEDVKPNYIGLSVMSSLYLETVIQVNKAIKAECDIPIIWGGVYPTLFPKDTMKYADYVIRGEGELALVELLRELDRNGNIEKVENLAYETKTKNIKINDVRPLVSNLDELGYPQIMNKESYFIHNNKIEIGDPQEKDIVYEMTASRGCPFTCSYCSSINLKRLYMHKGKYVRFRSVDSVINELKDVKNRIKRLRVIHFWDEIFSDDPNWIKEFEKRYKSEINLPFKIWGHPLKINQRTVKGLVNAGLYQMVVGIQSGSPKIRKDIFHRGETQEDIIDASRILSHNKVPKVIYDLMLQHPFETTESLIETFELCLELAHPFELQIHGLNFLPGTDIVEKAVLNGYLTMEEMKKTMYGNIDKQYDAYWGVEDRDKKEVDNIWVSLIYLTQFPKLKPVVELLANEVRKGHSKSVVITLQKIMSHAKMFKSLAQKAKLASGLK
ncbi:B12-binding domain-containing radical SAM protein [Sporosalibacterium faouarense]|uniref:B12-binding domain-containing radical SAM protein n=1 Tax=Sporosalibacterium faouarense TaxID=516123 RepID=UPI00192AE579|nr:radical SAM protein [Sporosalibacterium faouarense]